MSGVGTEYVAHFVSVSGGVITSRADWIGRVVYAAGRGRLSWVSGTAELGSGDYLLFDTLGAILVRAGSKSFTRIPLNFLERVMQPGMSMMDGAATNELDTLTGDSMLLGRRTTEFRLKQAYSVQVALGDITIDANPAAPKFEIQTTVEYWLARDDSLAARANGLEIDAPPVLPGKVLSSWRTAERAARHLLPANCVALRIVAHSETRLPPADNYFETTDTTQLVNIKPTEVDLSDLALPPDFIELKVPGLHSAAPVPSDPIDRWRVPPAPR